MIIGRIQTIIHFPMPGTEESWTIWLKAFPPQKETAKDIDWQQIAGRYELTGAGIINVVHFCAVEVLQSQVYILSLKQLESAIIREYIKNEVVCDNSK